MKQTPLSHNSRDPKESHRIGPQSVGDSNTSPLDTSPLDTSPFIILDVPGPLSVKDISMYTFEFAVPIMLPMQCGNGTQILSVIHFEATMWRDIRHMPWLLGYSSVSDALMSSEWDMGPDALSPDPEGNGLCPNLADAEYYDLETQQFEITLLSWQLTPDVVRMHKSILFDARILNARYRWSLRDLYLEFAGIPAVQVGQLSNETRRLRLAVRLKRTASNQILVTRLTVRDTQCLVDRTPTSAVLFDLKAAVAPHARIAHLRDPRLVSERVLMTVLVETQWMIDGIDKITLYEHRFPNHAVRVRVPVLDPIRIRDRGPEYSMGLAYGLLVGITTDIPHKKRVSRFVTEALEQEQILESDLVESAEPLWFWDLWHRFEW